MSYTDGIDHNVDPLDEPTGIRGQSLHKQRSVVYGGQLVFHVVITDPNGDFVDVDELYFDIFRRANIPLTRRYMLSEGEITHNSSGTYSITVNIPEYLVPGMYTARWTFDDGGDETYALEQFFVIDPPIEPRELLDPPRLAGTIREAIEYDDVGLGLTDSIVLIGHGDGLTVNDPYHVGDIQEAINVLQADMESPLLRGLMEAYNAGCRDIWLVASAPTREYISLLSERAELKPEWGNRNFYQRYAQRLEETYRILQNYDDFDVIVPIEAPFYDALGTDFFTPLVKLCADIFTNTGTAPVGVIGTRHEVLGSAQVEEMVNDPRLEAVQDDEYLKSGGKMVLVAVGEGVIQIPFYRSTYSGPLNISAGSYLAANALKRGLTFTRLPNVMSLVGLELSKDDISKLSNARLNPAIRTPRGKRGLPFNVVLATDNTMAPEGSDYWSVVQMRLVARVIRDIRVIGYHRIGSTRYAPFVEEIKTYLRNLQRQDYIRDYTFSISRDEARLDHVIVEVVLWPRLGVNDIRFTIPVGPDKPLTMTSYSALRDSYVFNEDAEFTLEDLAV